MKDMYKKISIGVLILFLFLSFFLNRDNSYIYLSILNVAYLIFSLWDYYLINKKIKKGIYLLIGKKKRNLSNIPFTLFILLIMVILLYFYIISTDVKSFYKNPIPLYYVPLMINQIFHLRNFKLLIKEKSFITDVYSYYKEEWSFSEIIKVVVADNKYTFYKKKDNI